MLLLSIKCGYRFISIPLLHSTCVLAQPPISSDRTLLGLTLTEKLWLDDFEFAKAGLIRSNLPHVYHDFSHSEIHDLGLRIRDLLRMRLRVRVYRIEIT